MSLEFMNAKAFWAMLALGFIMGAIVWGLYRRKAILEEFGRIDLLSQFSRFSFNRKILYQGLPTVLCFALLVTASAFRGFRADQQGNSRCCGRSGRIQEHGGRGLCSRGFSN